MHTVGSSLLYMPILLFYFIRARESDHLNQLLFTLKNVVTCLNYPQVLSVLKYFSNCLFKCQQNHFPKPKGVKPQQPAQKKILQTCGFGSLCRSYIEFNYAKTSPTLRITKMFVTSTRLWQNQKHQTIRECMAFIPFTEFPQTVGFSTRYF